MATHSPTTLGVKEDGREGARKGGGGGRIQEEGWREGGWEGGRRVGGSKGWWGREGTREGERNGESKEREVGSDDARQTVEKGWVQGVVLMKGTSEEGTGRGMDSGREEASGGGIDR